MSLTRGRPLPRTTWTSTEERDAIRRYTIPRTIAMKLWALVEACLERGVLIHTEELFFEYMKQATLDVRGRPCLISARHGAEMMARIPSTPNAARVRAAITASVFDTWNTKRYPCYTTALKCYLANMSDQLEWYNSTDLRLVRRQVDEHAVKREALARNAAAHYIESEY